MLAARHDDDDDDDDDDDEIRILPQNSSPMGDGCTVKIRSEIKHSQTEYVTQNKSLLRI